jgi:hypothetical protein
MWQRPRRPPRSSFDLDEIQRNRIMVQELGEGRRDTWQLQHALNVWGTVSSFHPLPQ